MKKYFYFLLIFLVIFSCQKKSSTISFSEKNILESRALLSFSRFSEDYYFWSEPHNFQNATVYLNDIQDVNGQKLSGRYKVSYGIYDDVLTDALLPNTLTSQNLTFIEGKAVLFVDLENLLTKGNWQNKEGWIWLEFIISHNDKEIVRTKVGTLVKAEREFVLDEIVLYSLDNRRDEVEIAVNISDPIFDFLQTKGVSPSFWVKLNDELPKLYDFQTDYHLGTAYLQLKKNTIPELNADTRLLVWHQMGEVALLAKVFVGQPKLYAVQACLGANEGKLLAAFPYNFAEVTKNAEGKVIILKFDKLQLNEVPSDIHCFRKLKELYMNYNSLTDFSPSIFSLDKLEVLEMNKNALGRNQRKKMPAEIYRLGNLQRLSLSGNYYIGLPETLKLMQHLKYLNITSSTLPNTTGNVLEGFYYYTISNCSSSNANVCPMPNYFTGDCIGSLTAPGEYLVKCKCAESYRVTLMQWLPNTEIVTHESTGPGTLGCQFSVIDTFGFPLIYPTR